jgi:hypothetical protein
MARSARDVITFGPMENDIKTPLNHNLSQIAASIVHSIESEWYLPAQILIYSSIDAAAWLAGDENAKVGERFCEFVDRWMLSKYLLPATAQELYAARCGILHTFTADSKLSKKGSARRVIPSRGSDDARDLQARLEAKGIKDAVVVPIIGLFDSFRFGYSDFLQHVPTDLALKAKVKEKISRYGMLVQGEELEQFLKNEDKTRRT